MICENPIILGGAGSSGSTLLVSILNRHPDIAAGDELSLFNKEFFFNAPFSVIKSKSHQIVDKGLCSDGWYLYPWIHFDKYGFNKGEIKEFINDSDSFNDFINQFYDKFLEKENKSIWAEKTPSNSYTFDLINKEFPKTRFIHIYRDGRDVITSFIKRGMSPYFASLLWIYNTSMALRFRGMENYYEIRYEDLVENPEKEIGLLCDFLNVSFDDNMLDFEKEKKEKLSSWNHSPSGKISADSIGRYSKYLTHFHYYVFYHSSISAKHFAKYNLKFQNAKELQTLFGFECKEPNYSLLRRLIYFLRLCGLLMRDSLIRYFTLLKFRNKFPHYPGRIKI